MFTSCNRLESIWATSFNYMTISTATYPLNGCRKLVGQAGYITPDSTGKTALSFGTSGVLTNPSQDQRTWVWGHLYDTGALEVSASATPDANRTVLATGRVCANANYLTAGAMPRYDQRVQLRTCVFLADVATILSWNLDCWFYGMTALAGVSGWANVGALASLKQAFNGCTGLASLDLSGLDPSALLDYAYAFAGCSNLVTIYVDSTWALASGASGMATFYN